MGDNSEALKRVSIFAGMDLETLEMLGRKAVAISSRPGAVILHEGETGNRLFFIVAGAVRVCKGYGTDHEVELAQLTQGDFFGEMCVLDTLPRSATVITTTDTDLLAIGSLAFLELYEESPKQYGLLLLNIARDLSRRLRQLDTVFTARF